MPTADFLTSDWLAMASDQFAHLDLDPAQTCRISLIVPDARGSVPRKVAIDVDFGSGGMRFDASPDATPGDPRVELPYELAVRFLLGSSLHRARIFETGRMRIVGNFIATYFLDRVLQQSKEIELIRARTANAPAELSVPCWPADTSQPFAPRHGDPAQPAGSQPGAPQPGAPQGGQPNRGDLAAAEAALPTAMRCLRDEIGTSTPGAQLYVSLGGLDGTKVASVSLGEASPGVPYTVNATPQWYCCAKPVTALAIGQLWEAGKLDPFRPVSDYLPRFGGPGRDQITLAHLLTHTSPVPAGKDPLLGAVYAPYARRRELVYAMRVRPRKQIGNRANYGAWWTWLLLAEVIEAVDGRPYDDYLRQEVLGPAGLTTARNALTLDEYRAGAVPQPANYVADSGHPPAPSHWVTTQAALTECVPGFMRGTMADLGRLFEILLAGGTGPGGQIITPQTLARLTARHRTNLVDPWGGADWGLGFKLECGHIDPWLISFSRHSSPRAFGHDGMLTCLCFTDPDNGLTVALQLNCKIEPQRHRERMIRICDAIYADLGLAS
jgi:CubicO group peptidase (beta-lactamase class C family)